MKRIMIPDKDVRLDGMPWYEHNRQRMWRLPFELEEVVDKELWETSLGATGARLRFRSDTTTLKIRLAYSEITPARNMTRIAKMGFDLYADGNYWQSVVPDEKGEMTGIFFEKTEKKMRNFTIYFPLFYYEVDILGLYFDEEADILPPAPYSMPLPIVFYGTSITHGGCASRPGLTYEAILARELNIDYINLGFSGCGKGERCVATEIARIDAACYVLDYGQNNRTVEELESVYLPFIEELRKTRPSTPILMSTPIFSSREWWSAEQVSYSNAKRKIVRSAYEQRISVGDENIHLIEGFDLLSPEDGEGFVDGVHPNDLGFVAMSKAYKKELMRILDIR